MGLTTLPLSCAVVTKSGNLNFLEPSGPLQACNLTALFYLFILYSVYTISYFPHVDQLLPMLPAPYLRLSGPDGSYKVPL